MREKKMENKNNEQFAISVDVAEDTIYETVYFKIRDLEREDKKLYDRIIEENQSKKSICKVISDIIFLSIKFRDEDDDLSEFEDEDGYIEDDVSEFEDDDDYEEDGVSEDEDEDDFIEEIDFVKILHLKNSDPKKFDEDTFGKMAETVLKNQFVIPTIKRMCNDT